MPPTRKPFERALWLMALLLVLLPAHAQAQAFMQRRTLVRTFKVSAATTVDITNKYGKVHVLPWSNDSVRVSIELQIVSRDSLKMQEILRSIDFEFVASGTFLTVKTKVGSNMPSIVDDLQRLAQAITSSESNVSIDYTVMVPNYVNIRIDNKYGDVYADQINGNFTLLLSNGDFRVNSLQGNADLSLKFSNGVITSMNNGRIDAAYAEIEIGQAGNLTIDTKSSRMKLRNVNILKVKSVRDKYFLDNIGFLYGDGYFSDFEAKVLRQEASMTLRYGSLNLSEISKEFSFINLDSQFADLNLFFARGTSYHLDIVHRGINLHYPVNLGQLLETVLQAERMTLSSGLIGREPTEAKVRLKASDCNVYIIHQ